MTKLGAIDWDETYAGFQYKLGYCVCGKKILATSDELQEVVTSFGYLETRGNLTKRLVIHLLKKLA